MSEQDELRQLRELVAQLTERVYRLERLGGGQTPTASSERLAPAVRIPAAPSEISSAPPPLAPEFRDDRTDRAEPSVSYPDSLERRIGSQWLNRVGVIAVLVGASYFLKLAFDNGWVGPGLRVLIGVIAGVGLCWWSERFRRPASLPFSYSLKAIGVGILYLSLWASFQLYHLLPGAIAFLAMILVTAATAALAVAQDAELLAGLALLGGLLTPVLCGTHENHEATLFSYLLLLSGGAFVLQRVKPWPRILFGAFVGNSVLAAAWFDDYYSNDQFAESLLFFTLLFALFAVAPLYSILEPERDRPTRQSALLLAILNAAVYFAAVYSQLLTSGDSVQSRASAYALGLAIVYLSLAVALDRRIAEHPGVKRLLPIAHYALASSFLTIGIALRLHQHWITLAWLLEGALLFWVGARTARRKVKWIATVVVLLGIVRLLSLDLYGWGVQQSLIANARFATFVVAIAVLLWMLYLDRSSEDSEAGNVAVVAAAVMVNLLVLLAAGLEIHDFFQLSIQATQSAYDIEKARHALAIARNFSYSALIMFYGAALMWLGFARNSALLRWQAILLIAATVLKVFFFDISALDHAWRVLSFIILGTLLLAVSYAYQRDWLGLQRSRSE
jgi:uncharacterized membrane protein